MLAFLKWSYGVINMMGIIVTRDVVELAPRPTAEVEVWDEDGDYQFVSILTLRDERKKHTELVLERTEELVGKAFTRVDDC